jgi:hypothetical protein
VKAALLATALLAGIAAPLAAQEPAATPAPGPGPIILVSASERLTAQLGDGPIDPAAELCLDNREEAVLASDRVTFTLIGGECFVPAAAEQATWDAYREEIAADAQARLIRAMYREDPAEIAAARQDYVTVMRNVMGVETDGMIEIPVEAELVEGTAEDTRPPPRKRARVGAVRGAPPPRPVVFRIASASPTVLTRFPRGTLVQSATALCLKAGEQVTVAGSNGQSVTYTGPGCLNRKARPTRENVGGFTFG